MEERKKETIVEKLAVNVMQDYITYGAASNIYGASVIQLATVLTYGRINKALKQGAKDDMLTKLRREVGQYNDVMQDLTTLDSLYAVTYTRGGERRIICTDSDRAADIVANIADGMGARGADLVQTAALKLLQTIARAERRGEVNLYTLLDAVTVPVASSMYYENGDIKPRERWIYKDVNGVKLASSSVSRAIHGERRASAAGELYYTIERRAYAADDVADYAYILDDVDPYIYRRASILSGAEVYTYDGPAPVADAVVQSKINDVIAAAHLSARERYCLLSHYVGAAHGCKSTQQLADELDITPRAVADTLRRARRKVAAAISPDGVAAPIDNNTPRDVIAYVYDDGAAVVVGQYSSVAAAARAYDVTSRAIRYVIQQKSALHGITYFRFTN